MIRTRKVVSYVAITALMFVSTAATLPVSAVVSTSGGMNARRLDCVGCDACNGAGGNHQTFANGGRDGVVHVCFEGVACGAHAFNSNCKGDETDSEASGEVTSTEVSWESIGKLEGGELERHLRESRGRWRLRSDLGTVQWTDCYGNLVASIPIDSPEQQAIYAAAQVASN